MEHPRYTIPKPDQPTPRSVATWARSHWVVVLAIVFLLVSLLIVLSVQETKKHDATQNRASDSQQHARLDDPVHNDQAHRTDQPIPQGSLSGVKQGELPPGGSYTDNGSGKFRPVPGEGKKVGEGREDHYTYVVEVEDTIDASAYGGDDAFAAMVEATLSNPKSWIGDKRFSFQRVDGTKEKNPDLHIQLTSVKTTHEVCGNDYQLETSCFMPEGNRVVLNESRWVRGAVPFEGDLGGYRQYMINHEVGHGIGYPAHVGCEKTGNLAPIMMQQTLSLNNSELYRINPQEVYEDNGQSCRPNPWVFPLDKPGGNQLPGRNK